MSYPFFFMAIRFLAWLSVQTWSNLSQSWFNLAAGGITLLLTDFSPDSFPISIFFLSIYTFSSQSLQFFQTFGNFFKFPGLSRAIPR